jgi:predicted metal-dependent HD superfamily phosphohydrolase
VAVHNQVMQYATLENWQWACDALKIRDGDREFIKLTRAWKSWGRHYHTLGHLDACLREFDSVKALAERPAEVAMALWFHDAVYKTYRKDNEQKSAMWAVRFMQYHGAATDAAARVGDIILATAHTTNELNGDAALTVDIDLSVLGQPDDIYREFERNVRREYWWVSKKKFVAGRSRILQSFLDRESIYHFVALREKYESQARVNLRNALDLLVQHD